MFPSVVVPENFAKLGQAARQRKPNLHRSQVDQVALRRGSVVVPFFQSYQPGQGLKPHMESPYENIWNSLKMKKCHGFKANFLDVSCDNLNFGGNYLRCWLDLSRYIIRECADHFPRLPGKWHETILAICYPHPKSCTITHTISSTISLHQLSWAVF